jgi:hypothetical protein
MPDKVWALFSAWERPNRGILSANSRDTVEFRGAH